ncbi:GNAT family N-acetyltransferase [Candidatus Berkiella cookevillensis]|uniref:Acetyltransferase n=1 Tax=Candidatus Berkiella cookevillensis TaxID=437022 RepID=A0A0Q9YEN6_9GAMM|nr:GNAT family N-acetyltransferase [Candidatus Berkiella cookevillensis]MCS5709302.1 GNAT family N-acetyltransferase [Candidatus Berkiella cookevillensis]
MGLTVAYLKDHPEYIPLVAKWIFETWGHYNPQARYEKTILKLHDHLNTESLPITYIALQDNKPVGTSSVRITDGIRPDLIPWLASLFVLPEYRGKGIAQALINAVKHKAQQLKYPTIYLLAFDQSIPQWYEKLGWQIIGNDALYGHSVKVMSIHIKT